MRLIAELLTQKISETEASQNTVNELEGKLGLSLSESFQQLDEFSAVEVINALPAGPERERLVDLVNRHLEEAEMTPLSDRPIKILNYYIFHLFEDGRFGNYNAPTFFPPEVLERIIELDGQKEKPSLGQYKLNKIEEALREREEDRKRRQNKKPTEVKTPPPRGKVRDSERARPAQKWPDDMGRDDLGYRIRKMAQQKSSRTLYKDTSTRFSTEKHKKHGGEDAAAGGCNRYNPEATLVDNIVGQPEMSLCGRAIVRHVDAAAYQAWKKAYEAADFWKRRGFDYVPIEPIVGTMTDKDRDTLDVICRVIDGPSVEYWLTDPQRREHYEGYLDRYYDFKGEMVKIRSGLEELGISWPDPHDGNFVLSFEKNEKGEARLDHPPRVYAIDLDFAW